VNTDQYKNKGKRAVAAVMNTLMDSEDDAQPKDHPVAAIIGASHPIMYMPSNASNVLEADSDSDDVSGSGSRCVAAMASS
jgi:hypothetical protein